jgi:hypothetical protein
MISSHAVNVPLALCAMLWQISHSDHLDGDLPFDLG